jgi:hypothetical protein
VTDPGDVWLAGVLVTAPAWAVYAVWTVGRFDFLALLLAGLTAFGLGLLWPLVLVAGVLAGFGAVVVVLVRAVAR